MLARRVLIFSQDQVYFERKSVNCFEALQSPLDALHNPSAQRFQSYVRAGLFSGQDEGMTDLNIFGSPFGRWENVDGHWDYHFRKYLVFVTCYTARDLAFDSDSIRAFMGILRYIKACHSYMGHLVGNPYVWPVPEFSGSEKSVDCVIAGLCWRHLASCWQAQGIDGENSSSCRVVYTKLRRREAFPSWSWPRWAGAVSWADLFTHSEMDLMSLVDGFRCELCEGVTNLSLSEYAKLRLLPSSSLPGDDDSKKEPPDVSALLFSAWVCPPEMLTLTETPKGPGWGMAGYVLEMHLSLFSGSPSRFLQAARFGRIQFVFVARGIGVCPKVE